MDELPRDAQRILALARSAQPAPNARARQRVHEHVHAVLSAGALLHSEQASRARGKFGASTGLFNGTKIMLASVALMIGTGATIISMREPPALVSNPPPAAPPQALPTPAEDVGQQPIEPVGTARAGEAAPVQMAPARFANGGVAQPQLSLAAELALLSQASDALINGDTSKAQHALAEHRRRFRNPQLREEREGLSVLVGCVERPHSAQSKAVAFVQKHPASVLATRIKRGCRLVDGS